MAIDGIPAACAAANASGGTSPTTSDGRIERSTSRSAATRASKSRVERRGPPHGLGLVEPEAVDLDDAGVALGRLEIDGRAEGQVEDPPLRAGSDHDRDVRAAVPEGVDDLDLARRVAEAVAGDVPDDGVHRGQNTEVQKVRRSEFRIQKSRVVSSES